MSPTEEQKFLRAALTFLENREQRRSWRLTLLEVVAMASIALIAFWVFGQPRGSNGALVLFLALSFASGVAIGGLSLWRALSHRGSLIRPYVDQDRMRARLSELEHNDIQPLGMTVVVNSDRTGWDGQ